MLDQSWYRDSYTISTDKTKLNTEVIHQFLSTSYWAKDRTFDQTVHAINHSVCFGLYSENQQIGFARVITDFTLFSYLADVFIHPSHQGQGLGKWLVKTILHCNELKNIKSWMLATTDAHSLYAKFQFKLHPNPELLMVRKTGQLNNEVINDQD